MQTVECRSVSGAQILCLGFNTVCVCIKTHFHQMLKESKQKEAFNKNVLKVVLENYSQRLQSSQLDFFFFFTHTKFSEKLTCAYNISLVLGFVSNNSKLCLYSKNRISLIEDEQLLSVSVTLKVTLSFTFFLLFHSGLPEII